MSLDPKLILKVFDSIIPTMVQWNNYKDEVSRFVTHVMIQTKIPEERLAPLREEMKSDAFWEAASKKTIKRAAWIQSKKKKAGSRIFGRSKSNVGPSNKKKGSKIKFDDA